jgi:putative ABC transport system ATP-binding protein
VILVAAPAVRSVRTFDIPAEGLAGPSGSGKSTLPHILGMGERPTQGTACLRGNETVDLSERGRRALRRLEPVDGRIRQ